MRFRSALLAAAVASALSTGAAAFTNEHGLDRRNFDAAVSPCVDFYRHANGGWLAANPVPADRSRWGTFAELDERNLALLHDILEDTRASAAAAGTNARRIADFYATAMDEAALEKAGHAPLAAELERVAAARSRADVVAIVRDWHAAGLPVLFNFYVNADLGNATTSIAYAAQGGLGLPDRDYYTREDDEARTLRAQYVAHVAAMLRLVGVADDAAQRHAEGVLALETRLAKASLTRVELRDPYKSYRLVGVAQADAETPNFPWSAFFAALGRPDVETFALPHETFFATMDAALADVPVERWQAYLRWHLARGAAPYLSNAFVQRNFEFYDRTLAGAKALRPRWKRALDAINLYLGEALGELYVARTFPPEAKAKALTLIENLRAALKARLEGLDWMGEDTKRQALAKLATFTPKIGYPDAWRDYSKLAIGRTHYFDNVRAGARFELERQVAKIGRPVDKAEWRMNPQRVNAYYNAVQNEIVFPAAILQPPFFDPQADDALNYGGIGAVIGHELLHGFDDKGSQFDAQGNLKNWWTAADRKRFTERTERLVAQASAAKAPLSAAAGDLAINGKLTLGENIGDLGGLSVAWDAFQIARNSGANRDRDAATAPEPRIGGLTPDQRFFLSWAQLWRTNYRDEALKLMVATDPHAPGPFRVNGPLANLPAFAQAFACKAGDPMVAPGNKRVAIW
jgi:putative endopeptidase